jgi:hypothetical protein
MPGTRAFLKAPETARADRTGWLTTQSIANQSLSQNSLVTGKNTGKFGKIGPQRYLHRPRSLGISGFSVNFPEESNSEVSDGNREIVVKNRDFRRDSLHDFCRPRFHALPSEQRSQREKSLAKLHISSAVSMS